MRTLNGMLLLCMMAVRYGQAVPPPASSSAQELLQSARAAIGWKQDGSVLTSVLIRGAVAEGLDAVTGRAIDRTIPLEIRALLPDWYVRTAGDGPTARRSGFVQGTLVGFKPAGLPGSDKYKAQEAAWIQDYRMYLGRLLLGALGETSPARLVVKRVLSSGDNDVIEVAAPDGTVLDLDLDKRSHVPIRIRFNQVVPVVAPVTRDEIRAGVVHAPTFQQEELTITFEDRRLISGLLLPHLVRKWVRGVATETLRFDSFEVNAPMRPADFDR